MFAVVIATHNSEATLVEALAALVPAAAEGVVREVVIADGGSVDATEEIADAAGCRWVPAPRARGARLAAGAAAVTRGEWLLFLGPDCVLDPGWEAAAIGFVERAARSGRGDRTAACFRVALDDLGSGARLREAALWLRSRVFNLADPHQGLLLSRAFYRALGGHRAQAAFSEADLVRRIGRRRLVHLPVRAVRRGRTPAEGGIRVRLGALLFWLRVPAPLIGRLVGSR